LNGCIHNSAVQQKDWLIAQGKNMAAPSQYGTGALAAAFAFAVKKLSLLRRQ